MTSRSWARWARRFEGGRVGRASMVRLVVGVLVVGGLTGPLAAPMASAQDEVSGSVEAWGNNSDGQSDVPDDLGPQVTAVAAASAQAPDPGDPRAEAFPGNATTCDQAGLPGSIVDVEFVSDGTFVTITSVPDGVPLTGTVIKGDQAYNVYPGDVRNDMHSPINDGGNIPEITHWFSCGILSTVTVVTSGPNPGVVGQPVQLVAEVSSESAAAAPSGSVRFEVDGASFEECAAVPVNADGRAVCDAPVAVLVPVGEYEVTAHYSGDDTHEPSSSEAYVQETVQADTTTRLSVRPSAGTVVGEPTTLTAVVRAAEPGYGAVGGSVVFYDGEVELGRVRFESTSAVDGSLARLAVRDLGVGEHALQAEFGGSRNFITSTSNQATVTVDRADTITRLSAAPMEGDPGEEVTLTATVAPVAPGAGAPSGTVTFADGEMVLGEAEITEPEPGGSTVTFATSELAPGSHELTATYEGDDSFTTSSSDPATVGVGRIASTTTLSADPNPAASGDEVTLAATVEPTTGEVAAEPTGVVEFFDGDESLGSAELGSPATLTLDGLAAGGHEITASYAGDNTYATSTSDPITLTVKAPAEDELPDTGTKELGVLAALGVGLLLAGGVFITRLRRS